MAAALAHQLNQPLGAIICNTQALQQFLTATPKDFTEVYAALTDIEADAKRAGDVIASLRAIYQRTGQQRGAVDANRLIQDTLKLLHSELVLKAVRVQMHLGYNLPSIQGNYVELQQVIINVTMNALDAITAQPAETRLLEIRTEVEAPENVLIAVQDSGEGLTAEQLQHLGEPFYTSKPNGMGMGLAISRSILEAHGGRLWARNNPERGATFYLSLPGQNEVA